MDQYGRPIGHLLAVSSLSGFLSNPREGHLYRAIKIFGYLKKYTKKGFIIDPRSPVTNLCFERVEPDLENQYSDFVEEVDPSLPIALMKELDITIFVDADHAHDKSTSRFITGMISLWKEPLSAGAQRDKVRFRHLLLVQNLQR